ncbi:unnamed protein product [Euphydryas editha]|uniref:Uncharacterized protein n=1 Tax=Euphydryas editha TaxID=104508 RepID=A0AAU9TV08_EUPED|nr:unnamed protein product [Euphydryas editha]
MDFERDRFERNSVDEFLNALDRNVFRIGRQLAGALVGMTACRLAGLQSPDSPRRRPELCQTAPGAPRPFMNTPRMKLDASIHSLPNAR